MSELTELERAVVEASLSYFDWCQIDLLYIEWSEATERLKAARGRTA